MPKSLPGPCTVLVVDDDEIMRELLLALLASVGHAVHAVASGAEALDWLRREPVDVVLADLRMPGLEGAELAGKLNDARQPATMLIGMSGSEPKRSERALFDAFLAKPFSLEDFRRALNESGEARETLTAERNAAASSPVLDEAIYAQLAAMLPAKTLRELYRVSADDVQRRVARMREAVARGDMEECRREAHAIKGGCGMVGATELSALAARIEAGSFADTPPLDEFAVACMRLKRMLDARS